MRYDLDKIIDRHNTGTRKWNSGLLEKNFDAKPDVIPMHIADMDFKAPAPIVEALQDRASIPDYSYGFTSDEYYDALISWNKRRFGIDLQTEWIKLLFGTVGTLLLAVQSFTKAGDAVLFNTPIYEPFHRAVKFSERKEIHSPLIYKDKKYYLDFEQIEQLIIKHKIKLYLFCSPHNPGGRIWTKEELFRLSEICLKYDVVLLSDEVHRDMIFEGEEFYSINQAHPDIHKLSVTAVSLNKGFDLGGLKSSYAIIPNEEIREKFFHTCDAHYITSPNCFIVPATIAAYEKCEDWLDQVNAYVQDNFKYFASWLKVSFPKAEMMHNQASYLAWVYMGAYFKTEGEIKDWLKQSNVTASLGSDFVSDGELWLRFNLGTTKEILKEACKRLEM